MQLESVHEAVAVPRARTEWSNVAEMAVTGAQVTSVLVSLAQIPMVIEDLAQRLSVWSRGRNQGYPAYLQVHARGKAGTISLTLTDTTHADEILRAITCLLDDDAVEATADE